MRKGIALYEWSWRKVIFVPPKGISEQAGCNSTAEEEAFSIPTLQPIRCSLLSFQEHPWLTLWGPSQDHFTEEWVL